MKKSLLISLFIGIIIGLFAQNNSIKTLTLSNGMNVVLCEDHEQPQIYGAVCVHVGAKNDPLDNTGMAHYFEHIMFKGTDKIGTLDWSSEKVYLDSISNLYDELHTLTDPDKRNAILLHINDLSNKATEYAIPNEVDVILGKMGGEGVNAFTSNDVTCYHNYFPSNQLEKWLLVYTERLRNPVFRLFQSELETVYEEYNMYQDNPMSTFMEDALAEAYGNHPYGRPVIGYPEHLKNPQTSAMQKFFNQYYHPFNMTLILVGDFDANSIKPILEKTIGQLHNEGEGVNQELALSNKRLNTNLNMDVKPFEGHKVVNVKQTPVKMGIIGFQTLGTMDKNEFYFDIISNLLNNASETGLLDKLSHDKKLMAAQAFNYGMLEKGVYAFFYVPKILGQSHEQAEELIFAAIDSLKKGNFSDDLFEAVKMEYLSEYLTDMESLDNKFDVLLSMVMSQQTPEFYYEKEKLVRSLTKQDIVKIANRYFGNNCLIFRSDMGVKSHEKLQKPAWKPIVTKNTDAKSEYAKSIEQMPVKDIQPQNLDFKTSVNEVQVNDFYRLYASKNPYNDIFSMNIVYNYGNVADQNLSMAISYLNLQGTQQRSFNDFQLALQKLGASMYVYSSDDRTYISISGFDKDMKEILTLCREKLRTPENNESMIKKLIEDEQSSLQMMKTDASSWGRALYNYAMYKQRSPYLYSALDFLKKTNGKAMLDIFSNVFNYDGYITYVGKLSDKEVVGLLQNVYGFNSDIKKGALLTKNIETYKEPTLYVVSNKQFLQSNIYFYIPSNDLKDENAFMRCQAFNEYMGGSMAGVIFQEIRELRSLGYSAYGYFGYDMLHRRPGYMMGYLGTQADKTVEGTQAMTALLVDFPDKPEKFETAKTSAIKKMEAEYITFRRIPAQIHSWQERGYKSDPTMDRIKIMQAMSYQDIQKFHEENVAKRPLVITVAGDKKRIDMKALGEGYKVIELKFKDIIR